MAIFIDEDKLNYFNALVVNPFDQWEMHGGTGADVLIGGFLDDVIFGDQGNDILMGFLGNNTLDGGSGDDHVFGFMDAITIVDTVSGDINFSSNTLIGGDGNDTLAALAGVFSRYVSGDDLHFSLNVAQQLVYGGSGNDAIFGGAIDVSVTFASCTGLVITNSLSANTLDGGSGDDLIVGYLGYDIVVHTNVQMISVDNFDGKNLLYGGSGDDVLIGEISTFTHTVTNSSGLWTFNSGDSILEGGTGDDLIIGDMHTVSMTLFSSPYLQYEIHFGDDTLIGGQGNDTLVGDVLNTVNMDALEFFGNDTFVFDIDNQNGNDVIKDMNTDGVNDTLQFSGAASVAAVDAASTFSNSGGHVLMSFASGSVLFENISYAGQNSVLDITPNIVIV